jgi:hypothetical protein
MLPTRFLGLPKLMVRLLWQAGQFLSLPYVFGIKEKRLDLWWQLYITETSRSGLRKFKNFRRWVFVRQSVPVLLVADTLCLCEGGIGMVKEEYLYCADCDLCHRLITFCRLWSVLEEMVGKWGGFIHWNLKCEFYSKYCCVPVLHWDKWKGR